MRLLGFSEEAIKEELEFCRNDNPEYELWPEHVDAFRLFLSVQHQWRTPPLGGKPFGLDYSSARVELEIMFPKKRHRELWQQLKHIEAGALKAWPTKN